MTSPQRAAARLIVKGQRQSHVAHELGLHPRTITRWKHLPAFAAEIVRLQGMIESSLKSLAQLKEQKRAIPQPRQSNGKPPPQSTSFADAVIRLSHEGLRDINSPLFRQRMRELGFTV